MLFRSVWIDREGVRHTGLLDDRDSQAIHDRLAADGSLLLTAVEANHSPPEPARHGLSPTKRLAFVEAMETSLSAGVTVLNALEALSEGEIDARDAAVYDDLIEQLRLGATMADAMAAHPRSFGVVANALVRAGEQSGKLDRVFGTLAQFWTWQAELASTARQAMIYPIIILSAAYGLIIFLMTFVVPSLGGVIRKLGDDLPGYSRVLIESSDFVAGNLGLVLGVTAGSIVSLVFALRTRTGKAAAASALAKLPLARGVVHTLDTARFCRTMAAMLHSGLTLVRALELTAPAISHPKIRNTLEEIHQRLLGGEKFSDTVRDTGALPPLAASMLRVGEDAGSLPACFDRLGTSYDKQARAAVAKALAVLEPVATVFLGVIVGGVAAIILSTLYTAIGGLAK